ncbi:hypothetical protein COB52_02215 [Candidatus Kaiserbacteria bacterium]|nr:MAG: hypothetical protein COB52_02215 [Candidatus Kaiserbacteria bacterium]
MKKILFSISMFLLSFPGVVSAACARGVGKGFQNPLCKGLDTVAGFTEAFLNVVTQILFPVAVLFIVYSGFLFAMAGGNTDKLTKAKGNLLWVIIGVALLLGAFALATLIKGTIDPILAV